VVLEQVKEEVEDLCGLVECCPVLLADRITSFDVLDQKFASLASVQLILAVAEIEGDIARNLRSKVARIEATWTMDIQVHLNVGDDAPNRVFEGLARSFLGPDHLRQHLKTDFDDLAGYGARLQRL